MVIGRFSTTTTRFGRRLLLIRSIGRRHDRINVLMAAIVIVERRLYLLFEWLRLVRRHHLMIRRLQSGVCGRVDGSRFDETGGYFRVGEIVRRSWLDAAAASTDLD